MAVYSLDGKWMFRVAGPLKKGAPGNLGLKEWMPAVMPGTLHYHLQKLGKIPDPYYGRNELQVQWVDEQDWEIQKTLQVKPADCGKIRQELVFDGIDTVAEVYLNGKKVGQSTNMFRSTVCDVKGVLKPGKNEIRVLLKSPTVYAWGEARKNAYRVNTDGDFKWETGETRQSRRSWIRKVQCHFGWDWGLYLAVSGLWRPAKLECSDAPRIASLQTTQEHIGPIGKPTQVLLKIQARLESKKTAEGILKISCDGRESRVIASLKKGENNIQASLVLDKPCLWWPAGEGSQPLYEIEAVWEDRRGDTSRLAKRIGLRTLELVTKKDRSPEGASGESFYFKVNGRPVFMKGADWIPADAYVDRCTSGVYRHLLKSMVKCHMNMVRVWGGGWYELDEFYDLCDEMGILVWQDFMMACAVYPDTSHFLNELTQEVKFQVRRLADHACLALWCGDNENASGLNHWWDKLPNGKKYPGIYRRVMAVVQKACQAEDPARRFWISSPSNGKIQGDPDDLNRGDVHYWHVWHGGKPFSNYLEVKPRFASEFGFQSFPEPNTIASVVPESEMNVTSRVMEHHQRSPKGNVLLTGSLAREMPIPKDFNSFCWATQVNQAMAIRMAVEHWRRAKPWCMGALFWQLNDLWPLASWSSIDYYGRWKALQHEAGRFFAPLLASLTTQEGKLSVWATSDIAKPLRLKGELEVMTFQGRRVVRMPLRVKLKPGESRCIASWPLEKILKGKWKPEDVICFVKLAGDGFTCDNHAALAPWKWVSLQKPKLQTRLRKSAKGLELVVKAGNVVPFFHAELKGHEGHFGGDWRVLRPGKTYVMPWVCHEERGAKAPALSEAQKSLQTRGFFDLFNRSDFKFRGVKSLPSVRRPLGI